MIDYLMEEVLALDEAYLTRAIAQEVFGMDKLVPDKINADGMVMNWMSDEQERAVETGQYTWAMDVALSLIRSIGEQINRERRLRLINSAAVYLQQLLSISHNGADPILFEVITMLTPRQIAQAFLMAWRHEVDICGPLPYLNEDFLLDLD